MPSISTEPFSVWSALFPSHTYFWLYLPFLECRVRNTRLKYFFSTNYLVVLRREYYDGLYKLGTAFMAEIIAGIPFLLAMPFFFG